jgi:Tfp pilus assembly major pilin PilA
MKKTIGVSLLLIAVLLFLSYEQRSKLIVAETEIVQYQAELERVHAETHNKVESFKDEVVNDLARKCETQGSKEPDAVIIFDSNNQASIGSWQYQIKTVQHYVKVFEDRNINRVEAIQIAIDHDKAFALTKKILFEDSKGANNWLNCANKLNLHTRIEQIKKFE